MRAALATSGEAEESYSFEFLTGTNGFASAADAPCIAAFHRAIEQTTGAPPRELIAVGASDGRYFARRRDRDPDLRPPARRMRGHAANESVPLADLAPAAEIQLAVVEELLGFGVGLFIARPSIRR